MKRTLSKSEILALILASLLPLGALVLGIIMVVNGTLLTLAFIIAFMGLPVCVICLVCLVMFTNLASWKKALILLPTTIVFCAAFLLLNLFGTFKTLHVYRGNEAEEPYFEVWGKYDAMPSPREVGGPEAIEYYDMSSSMVIFVRYTDTLICTYSEEEYAKEKARIEESYVFEDEPCIGYGGHYCESSAEIDGYTFRLLETDGQYKEIDFPKMLIIIGTNDETCEIVYTAFSDFNLDYIESLEDFINEDCGWHKVTRKRKSS